MTNTWKSLINLSFHSRWGILFSHPRDYTPVCTTELGRAARLCSEFSKRNVKMIALSIDSVEDHHGWSTVPYSSYSTETTSGLTNRAE